MQTQNSAPTTTSGGQNPGITGPMQGRDGLEALAQVVEQFETPPASETASAQTPSGAEPDPDPAAEPTEQTESSGENETLEETPPGDEPVGEEQTDLSQSDLLASLDEETKTHALELAKLIKSGELKPGEIPRINKLIGQKHEAEEAHARELETLRAENEQLKSAGAAAPAADMPETVAKLKTVHEIAKREMDLKRFTNWAARNRDGGNYGGTEFSPEEVMRTWEQCDEQLLVLPQRKEQLAAEAKFAEARRQTSAQIRKDFPILNDDENPDTKAARQLMRDPRFQNEVHGEFIALALAVGSRVLQSELKTRTAPKAALPQQRPASAGVQKAKPASGGGGGAPAAPRAGATLEKAKERVEKERSVGSLADLISAQK